MKPDELTLNGWAVLAGVNRGIWGDIRHHGNPSRKTLQKLLQAIGSSIAEFEALRIGAVPEQPPLNRQRLGDQTGTWRMATQLTIPCFASSLWGGGEIARETLTIDSSCVVDHYPCPPSLTGETGLYILHYAGRAMWPRFRSGQRLMIAPARLVSEGDDVIIRLRNGGNETLAIVGELVRREAEVIVLRQFSPDREIGIGGHEVSSTHRVLGPAY